VILGSLQIQIKSTPIGNARTPNIIKASSIDKKAQMSMKTCKHKNKNTQMEYKAPNKK
jgi:hypothetical protein